MGRRPIGEVAMTGAERVARYRLQHRMDKPDFNPMVDLACLRAKAPRSRKEAKALKVFDKSLQHIFDTNDSMTDVKIPRLNDEQRAAALRCLKLSIRMLLQHSKRIAKASGEA
jgi:hypothetical protein